MGRYRLLRRLGAGGMGEVFLACSHGAAGFEKLVALKVVRPDLASNEENLERLRREARLGARLHHDSLVSILDLDEADGTTFLVMEYLRGFTLSQVLRFLRREGATLPLTSLLATCRMVARGLAYMHDMVDDSGQRLSITHGDVTPSNILLAADGRVKLADFGVATALGAASVAGKLPYLPLEALEGGSPNAGWDLFALGAVLYEMVAGQRAFQAENFDERLDLGKRGPPPCPPTPLEGLSAVIDRTLAQGFGSARALLAELDKLRPASTSDAEQHREFVSELFDSKRFVGAYGELPSTSSIPHGPSDPIDVSMGETQPLAPTAAERRPLRFGLSPAHGPKAARKYGDRLAARLGRAVEAEVRPVVLGDYETLIDCLCRGDIDVAWAPPAVFAECQARGAGLVVSALRNGQMSYRSVLLARSDGPKNLEELRGASVAFVDQRSASGYLLSAAAIRGALGSLDDVDARFLGSHRQVVEAIQSGWVDVGSTYATCASDGSIAASGATDLLPLGARVLDVVYLSGEIPADVIAHAPDLNPAVVERVRAGLLALTEDSDGEEILREIFRADCFQVGDVEAYDRLSSLRR